LAIGLVSGFLVGVAVFSHVFSPAMVIGVIADAIMVDGAALNRCEVRNVSHRAGEGSTRQDACAA
jgi:hypothetical protein